MTDLSKMKNEDLALFLTRMADGLFSCDNSYEYSTSRMREAGRRLSSQQSEREAVMVADWVFDSHLWQDAARIVSDHFHDRPLNMSDRASAAVSMISRLLQAEREHAAKYQRPLYSAPSPSKEAQSATGQQDDELHPVARLYYTGMGARRYRRASTQDGPGEPLCFLSVAKAALRRKDAKIAALRSATPSAVKHDSSVGHVADTNPTAISVKSDGANSGSLGLVSVGSTPTPTSKKQDTPSADAAGKEVTP